MQNVSEEINDAFQKKNGMTIDSALSHVTTWISDKNYTSASAGLTELKNFIPHIAEVKDLEKELRIARAQEVQVSVEGSQEEEEEVISNLSEVSRSEKIYAALGYFGWACLLPLLMKKESEFCQFHGKQAFFLALVYALIYPGALMLSAIGLHGIGMFAIVQLAVSLFGCIRAYKGDLWDMPFFGELARKFPL